MSDEIRSRGTLRDVAQLVLGHSSRFRRPELQDIATKGLRVAHYPTWVLRAINATLRARMELTYALVLVPRQVGSRVAFHVRHRALAKPRPAGRPTHSLLCPTRGRPRHVETFLTSLARTAACPERLEILLGADADDPAIPRYREVLERIARRHPRLTGVELVVSEPMPVPKLWNVLARRSRGDVLMMANDDQVYVDYGWDLQLDVEAAQAEADEPDGIHCLYFDAGQYPEGAADFPIVSRAWFDELGYFTPEQFEYWEQETWTFDIARRIDRLRAVPGILVEHRHYQDYKAPFDLTYQRHRTTREKALRDRALFQSSAAQLDIEAQRLAVAIAARATAPPAGEAPAFTPATRAVYVRLIDALAGQGRAAEAARIAGLAVEQGVWHNRAQRPTDFVPTLTSRPVWAERDFWFVPYLEEQYPRIRAELDAVTDPAASGFRAVQEPLVAQGTWEQVVLWEGGQRFEQACARFPVTAEVMAAIPEATEGTVGVVTLSWLQPGTIIVPHCGATNARLRVHLGLRGTDGASIRVGGQLLRWAAGQCIVFDDSYEHEARHDGHAPRVVLLFDIWHPELSAQERDERCAGQTSLDEQVVAYLREHGLQRVELDAHGPLLRPAPGMRGVVERYLQEMGAVAVQLDGDRVSYDRADPDGAEPARG